MAIPQTIVLCDAQGCQLGTLRVPTACQLVAHEDVFYLRTPETVRLRGRAHAPAIVFRETDPWIRFKLEPI